MVPKYLLAYIVFLLLGLFAYQKKFKFVLVLLLGLPVLNFLTLPISLLVLGAGVLVLLLLRMVNLKNAVFGFLLFISGIIMLLLFYSLTGVGKELHRHMLG